jgi:hypothetical protein
MEDWTMISPWRVRAGDEPGTHQVFTIGQRWQVVLSVISLAETLPVILPHDYTVAMTGRGREDSAAKHLWDCVLTFRSGDLRDMMARALGVES